MIDPTQNPDHYNFVDTKRRKFRLSALYMYITRLITEKSNVLADVTIEDNLKPNVSVYYLKFKISPVNQLFPGATFLEHHLTIHKNLIATPNSNYRTVNSLAHYTASYLSSEGKIVAHVYLDINSEVQHIQAKLHQDNNKSDLLIESQTEKLLRNNAIIGEGLLKTIILNCNQLHTTLLSEVEYQITLLTALSENLTEHSYDEYIGLAEQVIQKIDEANKYFIQGYDKRSQIFRRQIIALQNKNYIAVTKAGEVCDDDTINEEIVSLKIETKLSRNNTDEKDIFYAKVCHLHKQYLSLKKELERTRDDIDLLIKLDELVNELRFNLLILSGFIPYLSSERISAFNSISQSLKTPTPLLDLFVTNLVKGELEIVKKLYPQIKLKKDFDEFVYRFLDTLHKSKPGNEGKLHSCLEYLYQVDLTFRLLITGRTRLNCIDEDGKTLITPLILFAALNNHFALYELCLQYGPKIDTFENIIGDKKIPALYHIISLNDQKIRFKFMAAAVKHGAKNNCRISKCSPTEKIIISSPEESKKRFLRFTPKKKFDSLFRPVTNYDNIIDILLDLTDYNCAALFLPQIDFQKSFLLLAKFAVNNEIETHHLIPAKEEGIKVIDSRKDLNSTVANLFSSQATHKFIMILCSKSAYISHFVGQIHEQKLLNIDQDALAQTYTKTIELAKIFARVSTNLDECLKMFTACLFMLYLMPRTLVNDIKILQVNSHLVECFKTKAEEHRGVIADICGIALDIIATGPFADKLKSTQLYQQIANIKMNATLGQNTFGIKK